MTKEKAGKCLACKTDLYYIGGDYKYNIQWGVDVYMKPHYGSKFADVNNTNKSVKCLICDCCFEELMKSLGKKSVLVVEKAFP